jgi:PGF-pre-PGF domain-containing protein
MHGRYASIGITIAVVIMMILSGPVSAVSLGITGLDGTNPTKGESISFNVTATIENTDRYVPIDNFSLDITGATSKEVVFSTDGNVLSGDSGISVAAVTVPSSAYGQGVGYGYDSGLGYGYDFGYGYGYGYGYGAGGEDVEYKYTITLDTSILNTGAHEALLSLNTGNSAKPSFESSSASFEISAPVTTPAKATITGTIYDGSGSAIENAKVTINTTSQTTVYTNIYGKYTAYVAASESGITYSVIASASNYDTNQSSVEVTPGQTKVVDMILDQNKVEMGLAAGENALQFVEIDTNATFRLNIKNYGSSALFDVSNSTTNASVHIDQNPIELDDVTNNIDLLVNVTGSELGVYPITIMVTNSTQRKSSSIDIVVVIKDNDQAYTDATSNVTDGHISKGSVIVGNSTVNGNATVTNGSVFNQSTVTGSDTTINDAIVKDHSTVLNASVLSGSIVTGSTVSNNAVVSEGSYVEGSTVTSSSTINNATLTNVVASNSHVENVEISNVILENAIVVSNNGEAQITAGKITTGGIVFEDVYEATLVRELVVDQLTNSTVSPESPIVDSRDMLGTYINLDSAENGTIDVTICSISPDGPFSIPDIEGMNDGTVVGDFVHISSSIPNSGINNAAIRIYIDEETRTAYDGLYVVYHNTTTGEMEILEDCTIAQDEEIGRWYVSGNTSHFSTFGLLAVTEETATTSPSGSGSSSGRSSSSSGGSSGASGEAYENIVMKEVKSAYVIKDAKVSYQFNEKENNIDFIKFDALKNSGMISVTIEVLKDTSALAETNPAGKVYRNMNIWVGKAGYATPNNLVNPVIGFRVERSWIDANDFDESAIKLNRYHDGTWNPLPTTKVHETEDYIYFEAKTPGFSPFAITGETNSVVSEDEGLTGTDTTTSTEGSEGRTTSYEGENRTKSADAKTSIGNITMLLSFATIIGFMGYIKRDDISKYLKKK